MYVQSEANIWSSSGTLRLIEHFHFIFGAGVGVGLAGMEAIGQPAGVIPPIGSRGSQGSI